LANLEILKSEIVELNNQINEEMYGRSLDWQKVDISGDRIVILSLNRRITLLKQVDERDSFTSRLMDLALLNKFKLRFQEEFEMRFDLKIRTILKDYDPVNQLAGTILLLVKPVSTE